MASQTARTVGCSGCLIEAIERHDERRLRELLSAEKVQYSDTYWVLRANLLHFMTSISNFVWHYPMLTRTDSLTSQPLCAHPLDEETPTPGQPAHIAMSVLLSSMLHTTAEFNAFQMLVESHKFDVNEPLMFHIMTKETDWRLFIVDLAGMALLLDKGTDIDEPNSFLLVKTLVRICSVNPQMDLQSIEIVSNFEWRVCRGSDALTFIYNICTIGPPLIQLSGSRSVWLLALLKALSRVGLCLKSRVGSTTDRRLNFNRLKKLDLDYLSKDFSILLALFILFRITNNVHSEYFVGQLIRCGWIGASSYYSDDEYVLYGLIKRHLVKDHEILRRESLFRIAHQLLALGIFRERGALNFHYYNSLVCVRSLLTEFLQNSLSLLQLSRAVIRRLLGINDFEHRVQTLPLPPPLLEYVWRANEMLAESLLKA